MIKYCIQKINQSRHNHSPNIIITLTDGTVRSDTLEFCIFFILSLSSRLTLTRLGAVLKYISNFKHVK